MKRFLFFSLILSLGLGLGCQKNESQDNPKVDCPSMRGAIDSFNQKRLNESVSDQTLLTECNQLVGQYGGNKSCDENGKTYGLYIRGTCDDQITVRRVYFKSMKDSSARSTSSSYSMEKVKLTAFTESQTLKIKVYVLDKERADRMLHKRPTFAKDLPYCWLSAPDDYQNLPTMESKLAVLRFAEDQGSEKAMRMLFNNGVYVNCLYNTPLTIEDLNHEFTGVLSFEYKE